MLLRRRGLISAGALAPIPYMFDDIDNLYAVHGTKLLVRGYAGALVRIRRSSDSTEQDFSPIAAQPFSPLDSAAIASFIGGGTGEIRTVYDQSGNSRPAEQTTAGNQPRINLSLAFPFIEFRSAASTFLTISSALAFAQNVAAASLLFHGSTIDTSNKDLFNVKTNAGNNYRISLRSINNNGQWESIFRTLDAGSDTFVAPSLNGVGWATGIARADYANGDGFVNKDGSLAQNLGMTNSNTSNTASSTAPIYGAWHPGGGYANVYMSGGALIRDFLTAAEANILVGRGARLKAA